MSQFDNDSFQLSNFKLVATDGKYILLNKKMLKDELEKIDVSHFSKGVYYLILTTGNKQVSKKVVLK
jgi:hypothetical protein